MAGMQIAHGRNQADGFSGETLRRQELAQSSDFRDYFSHRCGLSKRRLL